MCSRRPGTLPAGGTQGSWATAARIPGRLQETRTMAASSGAHFPGENSPELLGATKLRSKSISGEGGPDTEWRAKPFPPCVRLRLMAAHGLLPASCGRPLFSKCYFSHTWLKERQECYLPLRKASSAYDDKWGLHSAAPAERSALKTGAVGGDVPSTGGVGEQGGRGMVWSVASPAQWRPHLCPPGT